jgi:hypothetical protein
MADPVVVPAVVPAATPWHTTAGADADVTALWANKKWDTSDPGKLAVEVTKSYAAAEKIIGVPPDRVLRFPADPNSDTEAMTAIYRRLGAPTDAKEYDFPSLKGQDGKVTDTALDGMLREVATKGLLTKTQATAIAEAVVKHNTDRAAAAATEKAAALKTEHDTLAKNWGTEAPANKVIAQNAARALGMTPQEVQALEDTIGYARTMDTLRNIGTKIGEDKFVRPAGPGGAQIQTADQVKARIEELKTNKEWVARYTSGDKAALKEMTDLNRLLVGDEIEMGTRSVQF